MRRRKWCGDASKPSLATTAMIDVVFNLLVFFLCSPFQVPEGYLDSFLKANGTICRDDRVEELLIRLKTRRDGSAQIAIGGKAVAAGREMETQLRVLDGWLRRMTRGSVLEHSVVVVSEREVEYRHVVGVMNACRKANLSNISFRLPAAGLCAGEGRT